VILNNASGLDGLAGSSTLVSYSSILLKSSTTVLMTTGTFNPAAQAISNISYDFDGDFTLPYTTYAGLYISWALSARTGEKILAANTTVERLNVVTSGNGTLQLSTYDLTINGTTSIGVVSNTHTAGYYNLMKSGAGTVIFKGLVTLFNGDPGILDFSAGNPNVECQNGITLVNLVTASYFKSGTGTWSFTTNNQSISVSTSGVITSNLTFDSPITIANGLTLTLLFYSATLGVHVQFNAAVDGGDGSSKLLMSANTKCTYNSATEPMVTGTLDASTNAGNTWTYGNGAQDLAGTNHKNLTLNGGGVKRLMGNISVANTYTLTAPATVDLNGFTLGNP